MSIRVAMMQRFREEAVRLMQEIGVPGVSLASLRTNAAHRAQFRAMLVDAKSRLADDTENHAAVGALIEECDELTPFALHDDTPSGGFQIKASGFGFQVPRLDDPGPKKPDYDAIAKDLKK